MLTTKLVAPRFAFILAVFAAGHAWPASIPFPAQGNDTAFSLGRFKIAVDFKFQPFLTGNPFFDAATGTLTSPLLFDAATTIGRSDPTISGSAADTAGTPAGTMGTIVPDAVFSNVPVGFEDPAAMTREIHTQIVNFFLSGGGVAVRAGLSAPDQPGSFGEVVSTNKNGDPTKDLQAAMSFFDVFVDVDLPGIGSLYNKDALLIQNNLVTSLPPTVVYIHGGSSAIPLLFRFDDLAHGIHANDEFGFLVLAGHGVGFAPAGKGHGGEPGEVEFEAELSMHGNLPLPAGALAGAPPSTVPEPSALFLLGSGLVGIVVCGMRRRACARKP